jgi:hypothetical protein
MLESAAIATTVAPPPLRPVPETAEPTAPDALSPRLEIPAYELADALALEHELGISHALAQVLVRRGLRDPQGARAFLDPRETYEPTAFAGIAGALALIERHLEAGSQITVHGDYDVDGVCATAILVRALSERRLVPAEQDRGWLRRLRRHRRPACRERHPAADHRRLRDHRGRRGRGGESCRR